MKLSKTFKIILFATFFLFSWWLMWHTFNYKNGVIYIASKAWSDFAAHIPLIRSFSWGKNFPPEYPIFSGEPIRYHFLFYGLVGLLERIGLPLDWALNLPSLFSFALLLISIFYFANFLFKNTFISILSVILFLFNASLSFYYFFLKHPWPTKILAEIVSNQEFPAFAPYDQSLISGGFWNLNVFTNQRHFALPLSLLLILTLLTLKNIKAHRFTFKKAFLLGLIIGFLPFLHSAVFIMSLTVFGAIFLLFNQKKKVALILLVALIISLPQIYYLKSGHFSGGLKLTPGYLVSSNLTIFTFFRYWVLNLGLSFFLMPLGFFLSDRFAKKTFLAFCSVFVLGNLFQFGPDIAANHKFFNLWLIVGNMFVAYTLSFFWQKRLLGKILVLAMLLLLTLSGIIDFFAIKNDPLHPIKDAPQNLDVAWIKNNTPPNAIFLNTSYLYHPANLAGRKIFLGWPYFSWSIGYNTNKRDAERKKILEATTINKNFVCQFLTTNEISFVALDEQEKTLSSNKFFWETNFFKVYENKRTGFSIYDVKNTCQ